MSKAENARAIFRKGFNCSQAVLSSFADEYGLDPVMAYRVAAAFGGGMGHLGETCGSVTGALMVVGLKYGMTVADVSQSHAQAFEAVQEFVRQFRSRHGSVVCRDLLGFDITDNAKFRKAMKQGIPQKICPRLVQDAVEIVEGLIAADSLQNQAKSCECAR